MYACFIIVLNERRKRPRRLISLFDAMNFVDFLWFLLGFGFVSGERSSRRSPLWLSSELKSTIAYQLFTDLISWR